MNTSIEETTEIVFDKLVGTDVSRPFSLSIAEQGRDTSVPTYYPYSFGKEHRLCMQTYNSFNFK